MPQKNEKIRRSIDFDPEVYEKLKMNAKKNDRSVQYMITHIIDEYLKRPKTTAKKPLKFF